MQGRAPVCKVFTCGPILVRQRQKKMSEYMCVRVLWVCEFFVRDPVKVIPRQTPRTQPQASASDMAAACNTRRGSQWLAGQTQPE